MSYNKKILIINIMKDEKSFIGFSDESHWNLGRYRSISLITFPEINYIYFSGEIEKILRGKKDSWNEFKWSKLNNHNDYCIGCNLISLLMENVHRLRLDTIMWDIKDSRHDISHRDDELNLGRMYYKLIKDVLTNRWPDETSWKIHIDEHSFDDDNALTECLKHVKKEFTEDFSLFEGQKIYLRTKYNLSHLGTVSSSREPLISIPDLFAGLVIFSREKYGEYSQVVIKKKDAQYEPLFNDIKPNPVLSNSDEWRIKLLEYFDCRCKENKLGVSLKTYKGLRTLNQKNPINFWWYEPQHKMDKAPTKSKF